MSEQTSVIVSKVSGMCYPLRDDGVSYGDYEVLSTYWHIGEISVRYEQKEQIRAVYGDVTLKQLSKELRTRAKITKTPEPVTQGAKRPELGQNH